MRIDSNPSEKSLCKCTCWRIPILQKMPGLKRETTWSGLSLVSFEISVRTWSPQTHKETKKKIDTGAARSSDSSQEEVSHFLVLVLHAS